MHSSCSKSWLSAVAVYLLISFADAARTTVSCIDKACLDQPFDITCKISGDVESGISWTRPKDSLEVVTCNKNLDCVYSDEGYEVTNTATGQTLTIKKFSKDDLGQWMCRDGNRDLAQECDVTMDMMAPEGRLMASCDFGSSEKKGLIVSCAGVTSHGSPPVAVKMRVEGLDVDMTLSAPGYTGNVSLDAAGKNAVCSLEGPAVQCATQTLKSAICPQVGSGHECVSDGNCMENAVCSDSSCACRALYGDKDGKECVLNAGIVVGIVIGCLAFIAGVIAGIMLVLRRKEKNKGNKYTSITDQHRREFVHTGCEARIQNYAAWQKGSLDAEDVKKLSAVEKDIAAHSKKVSEITYELDGIDKGFMDVAHLGSALQKITRQVKAESESFMKMLETLDSLRFDESNKGSKIKRKNMADQIQRLLDRCDFLTQGVQHILQKSTS